MSNNTSPSLKDRQATLAQTLLMPSDTLSQTDLPEEKLSLYQNLINGTIEGCLAGIYPNTCLLLKNLPDKTFNFKTFCDTYRRQYPNTSYRLLPAVENFVTFLTANQSLCQQFPFLPELASYEWEETLLENTKDPQLPQDLDGNTPVQKSWSQQHPFWNPVSLILELSYNVPNIIQTIKQTKEDDYAQLNFTPENTWVLIYRDTQSFKIRYFILNPITMLLIQHSASGKPYSQVFNTLIEQTPALKEVPLEDILSQGETLLQTCYQQNILLGSIPSAPQQ